MKTLQLTADETVAYLLEPEARARIEAAALEASTSDPDFFSVPVRVLASNGHSLHAVRGSNVPRPPPEPAPEAAEAEPGPELEHA